ncbi:MAG: hypothetical protein M3N49_13690 [Candidatus Eremiobacteraeota bacterium]|nr:hypothetical protein [Candidatus Eremiobacteraeota bacterium]
MVIANGRQQVDDQRLALDDRRAVRGVAAHDRHLLVVQQPRCAQDRGRCRHFSDVVDQAGAAEMHDVLFGLAESLAQPCAPRRYRKYRGSCLREVGGSQADGRN